MTALRRFFRSIGLEHTVRTLLLMFALGATLPDMAQAGETIARVRSSGTLRVCIWPEYYGITYRNPHNQQLSGIDIDLSAELARSLGVKLVYVDSSFVSLVDDLVKERCDVSMHAVGVTAQRQQMLKFSKPYLRSGIYGVTTLTNRAIHNWDDIDRNGVVVAVQAGTFMEPVMKETLKHASLLVVRPPQTREQELESGRADIFMSDYPYSRRLLDNADWARLVTPPQVFNPIDYAYAVKPGDDLWLRIIDSFVANIKVDGRLDAAARRHGLTEIVEH